MKKLIVLAVAAAAGFLVWKKLQDDKAEQDLWTEATSEFADLRCRPSGPGGPGARRAQTDRPARLGCGLPGT